MPDEKRQAKEKHRKVEMRDLEPKQVEATGGLNRTIMGSRAQGINISSAIDISNPDFDESEGLPTGFDYAPAP